MEQKLVHLNGCLKAHNIHLVLVHGFDTPRKANVKIRSFTETDKHPIISRLVYDQSTS